MTSHLDRIFETRALTADEQIAHDDEPRNGIWWQPSWMQGGPADKRPLTQEQTDRLIANELRSHYNDFPAGDMFRLTEPYAPASIDLVVELTRVQQAPGPLGTSWPVGQAKITVARVAHCQRNGIHSDPLLRLLAYRVWGERDRAWQSTIDTYVRLAGISGVTPQFVAVDAVRQFGGDANARNYHLLEGLVDYFNDERRARPEPTRIPGGGIPRLG
jgi:hypothetical protein